MKFQFIKSRVWSFILYKWKMVVSISKLGNRECWGDIAQLWGEGGGSFPLLPQGNENQELLWTFFL